MERKPGDHEGRHYMSPAQNDEKCSGDPRGRQDKFIDSVDIHNPWKPLARFVYATICGIMR